MQQPRYSDRKNNYLDKLLLPGNLHNGFPYYNRVINRYREKKLICNVLWAIINFLTKPRKYYNFADLSVFTFFVQVISPQTAE